jgi:hypothetical protein
MMEYDKEMLGGCVRGVREHIWGVPVGVSGGVKLQQIKTFTSDLEVSYHFGNPRVTR